jgi:hypothetical protein
MEWLMWTGVSDGLAHATAGREIPPPWKKSCWGGVVEAESDLSRRVRRMTTCGSIDRKWGRGPRARERGRDGQRPSVRVGDHDCPERAPAQREDAMEQWEDRKGNAEQ